MYFGFVLGFTLRVYEMGIGNFKLNFFLNFFTECSREISVVEIRVDDLYLYFIRYQLFPSFICNVCAVILYIEELN